MPRDRKNDVAYLRDMLGACREVMEFAADRTWADYQANTMLRRSIERSVEIVGEAARMVSAEFQAEHPQIPWDKIIPSRHRLAHEYDRIDDSIVWSVAVRHVPVLLKQLEAIVPPDPGGT